MNIKESKASAFFRPYDLDTVYNGNIDDLSSQDCSSMVFNNKQFLLTGKCVLLGIPFNMPEDLKANNIAIIKDRALEYVFPSPVSDRFFMFLHSADAGNNECCPDGIFRPMLGNPRLGETVCDYIFEYADGSTVTVPVKRRININEFFINWGENSFECAAHLKPYSALHDLKRPEGFEPEGDWGTMQTKLISPENRSRALHWIYAFENPYVSKQLVSIRFIPKSGAVFLFGITGCNLAANPLRWEPRKKIRLKLPEGEKLNENGSYDDIDIDLGRIIYIHPVLNYDNSNWEIDSRILQPAVSDREFIVEYTANENACLHVGKNGENTFHLNDFKTSNQENQPFDIYKLEDMHRKVTVRVVAKETGKAVPVRIHMHDRFGGYIAPVNCHRIPNPNWFEDYGTDFVDKRHNYAYINGEAEYILPFGEIFAEISKGFEIMPVKKVLNIDCNTDILVIELERVLDWRRKGWVTADTHVHFLSPLTALLEGEAEGVNVVNLLASQWGEMFTNTGDFDGKTTIGSREAGGTGEYLVRVGTENRQHVLGHISLLGYEGKMITPLTTGGPDESAIGDPIAESLSGWAIKCREQNGISILPHFPRPRAEGAASLVLELIDSIELTSLGDINGGISPYSLSDWYKYLNCGYNVPAVGGTDKMSADTAVGTIRTYALIRDEEFSYESWKKAVKAGLTFVTYGALMEFNIEGMDMGTCIELPKGGGTLDIEWHVASAAIPVTKVELVVNGETREVVSVGGGLGDYSGKYSLKLAQSGWAALRVRGGYPDKPEVVIAHSSAVTITAGGLKCFNAPDAMTILEQIEGTAIYVRTIGTKAEERIYKNILNTLASAHRALHNRMHNYGTYHKHTIIDDHHK